MHIPKNHYSLYTEGVVLSLREYHADMYRILKQRGQTHQEAADFLGISVWRFRRYLWQRDIPYFLGADGVALEQSFRRWNFGKSVGMMFPGAFYSQQFLAMPHTHVAFVPYTRYMQYITDPKNPLSLPAPEPPMKQYVHPTSKRKRDLAAHKAKKK
jgi:hypothetical protein